MTMMRGGRPTEAGRADDPVPPAAPSRRESLGGRTNQLTPAELGYRMPAEWEPQSAMWLTWPHNPETWPRQLAAVEDAYTQMVEALAGGQIVNVLVKDEAARERIEKRLARAGVPSSQIVTHIMPTNDSWIRDNGPTFLVSRPQGDSLGDSNQLVGRGRRLDPPPGGPPLAMIDWIFNSWGGKYPPWELDNKIPELISQKFDIPRFVPGVIMEGGSIEVNGAGTCLTTRSCLLNKNRNPHLSQGQIEDLLKSMLGVTQILWLGDGIVGDDTDGHVDDIARFVSPDVVLAAVEPDTSDDNHHPLQENFESLKKMSTAAGQPLTVVPIPMPKPLVVPEGRLPASHANFLIGNKAVLVPVFGGASDKEAIAILKEHFPTREIVGIPSSDLVFGLGAVHCLSQQQPLS